MNTKTRHPGTDNGKLKFFGQDGIDIPVPAMSVSELVDSDLQQSCFERGWFIRFNARCRDLRESNGAEKMRAEVTSKVGDMKAFCAWMNEKAPRKTRTLDLAPLYVKYPKPTQVQISEYLQANGFKVITA